MPSSLRANVSRTTPSRPYDRHFSSISPTQSDSSHLSRNLPPASPIAGLDGGDIGVSLDHPGLPTYAQYKRIESRYLLSLSPRKRDKALITQAMFDKIWDVLHQPDACTVETPQFRFWVRKMFTLSRPVVRGAGAGGSAGEGWGDEATDGDTADEATRELERSMLMRRTSASAPMDDDAGYTAVVLHEHRPVAILEQLYELFCYCHVRAGHGGRDKTCAVIREHYSWVPKELTAQFVKACPTCALKRSGQVPGVDMAMRKVASRAGRKGRAMAVEVEEMPAPGESLGLLWPTTGGPLDPANPEPCGVLRREQERQRELEWFPTQEGAVGSTNPASPNRSASMDLLGNHSPRGWDALPGHPLATNNRHLNARRNAQERDACSPTKTELPSLASALSDESLDENVHLTSPERGPKDPAECLLPPALRPLRLLGPVASDAASDSPSSYSLQIDPVLLSYNYPGLGLSESASECQAAGASADHRSVCASRLATSDIPLLNPDEVLAAYTTSDAPLSMGTSPFSPELEASRRWTRDGPFDTVYMYHSATDDVGQYLGGPIS